MPIYKAPVEDVTFLLNDVFQIDRYDNLPGFTDSSADVREAILGEAAKLSEEVLQPLNRVGDLEGCKRHDDGSVTTPKGFKEAFKQVAEGGWLGLSAPTVAKSLEHMQQLGMLREITGRQRHRLFVYDAYLAILSEGTEPIR